MSAGQSFGKFVAEDPLPGQNRRVFLAHQRNSRELGAYVVKVVSVADSAPADVSAMARRWLDGVSLQDRVAQDWHDVVAPVVERPTKAAEVVEALNSGEVWYVTRRYAGSLKDVLDSLAGTPAAAGLIWMICRAVARGALAFKQVDAPSGGRRSHGNLKPGNVLINSLPLEEGKTEIVVSDPAPVLGEGPAVDPAAIEEQFERADLVELGKILFQLVAGRCLPPDWNWVDAWSSPDGDMIRWRQVFAKSAGQWRALCQELLAGGKDGCPASLADVERRLGTMRPRVGKPIMPKVLALAAVLVVTGMVSAVVTLWQLRGVIVVQVPNADGLTAEVIVRNRSQPDDSQSAPLVNGAVEFPVKSGNVYDVSLRPNGDYGRLAAPPDQRQPVAPRARKTNEFFVAFATLNVSAADVGGRTIAGAVSLGGETNTVPLPATFYLPPTNRLYQLNIDPSAASAVYPTNFAVLLDQLGQLLVTNVVLQPVIPGLASVSFRADARLPLTYQFGTNVLELGRDAFRVPRSFRQGETVAVTVRPPHPWRPITTNWTVPELNATEFPRDFLNTNTLVRLNWSPATDPEKTDVWVGRRDDVPQRMGSVLVSQATIFPPDNIDYLFVFQRPGYKSATNASVRVRPGVTNFVSVPDLEAVYGFVELKANLAGFKVYTNGVLLGAASGSNLTVNLPPFMSRELAIMYSNEFGILPERRLTVRVEPGETNRQAVAFEYVGIEINPTPAHALVSRLTPTEDWVPLPARRFFQAPGVTNRYRVEAEHFEPQELRLGYPSAGIPLQPAPVVLTARKYPVYFEVSPPEATLFQAAAGAGLGRGTNFLEFGEYTAVAMHLMLGSVTNTFAINPDQVVTQRWVLPSGSVSIHTGQDGLALKIYPEDPVLARLYEEQNANEWLRIGQPEPWTTPVLNASLPPGGYQVVFSDGPERATNRIQIALNQVTNVNLPQIVFLPPAYTNSLGMRFAKLPGQSAYIAEAPVTRAIFNEVLDPEGRHPLIRGDQPAVTDELPDNAGSPGTLPQASLTNMVEFCRLLTGRDATLFRSRLRDERWRYELPDVVEWRTGARSPGFVVPTIPDPNTGRTMDLPELVLSEGRYYHAERDPQRRLINVGSASLRQGRTDLGFRVVVRRIEAEP